MRIRWWTTLNARYGIAEEAYSQIVLTLIHQER